MSDGAPNARGTSERTRSKLLVAARRVACEVGVAPASARRIAAAAGVNQALVFYHFSTVSELIAAASDHYVGQALEHYRDQFAQASRAADLLAIAEDLRIREGGQGNVAFMTQILAGAPHDPVIAGAAHRALAAWTEQIEGALARLAEGTALADMGQTDGMAALITAAFVGLELYDASNPVGGAAATAAVATLTGLIDAFLTLGDEP